MMNLLINISEIAIITGDNIYQKKRDYLIDFWKKNSKEDFEKYQKITEFVKETDEDVIKKITLKNNIDILTDLKLCIKSNNTTDLHSVKNDILKKMDKLTEEEKKEVTKSITNVTNTKFGIKNEDDITKIYENMTKTIIIKDNKYRKIKIIETTYANIYIGGKIDGIDEKNQLIIEVKNRIHKLFYQLRNYEKVQIMCYMYLFKSKKGHLVEAHKKKDETNINIIEVDFDQDYMDIILEKIILFCSFYINFMNNHELKLNLLHTKDEIQF